MSIPANIQSDLDDLTALRRRVDFAYQNSPWSSGPSYRERLRELDDQIANLKRLAAQREVA